MAWSLICSCTATTSASYYSKVRQQGAVGPTLEDHCDPNTLGDEVARLRDAVIWTLLLFLLTVVLVTLIGTAAGIIEVALLAVAFFVGTALIWRAHARSRRASP